MRSWGRGAPAVLRPADQLLPDGEGLPVGLLNGGSDDRLPELLPGGLAGAILLGDPFASFDYVARAVRQSDGGFVDVTSSEIAAALQRHSHEVPLGDSAAVALASVYRMWEQGDLRESEGCPGGADRGPGR